MKNRYYSIGKVKFNFLTGFLCLSFFIIILFTVYVSYTPFFVDDYKYEFFNSSLELSRPYEDIPLISYYTDNFSGVSRFVPHLIIGLFQYLGKPVYNILSGIIFMGFGLLTAKTATNDNKKLLPLALISCGLLFFIINGFFQVAVWMSGAPNYIYVSIMVCIFILLLKSEGRLINSKYFNYIILFFIGLITGWTNEGFIVGLTGACLVYYFILQKRELTKKRLVLILGLSAGAICLCLSPLNIQRFFNGHQEISLGSELRNFLSAILELGNIRILPLLICVIVILFIANKLKSNILIPPPPKN